MKLFDTFYQTARCLLRRKPNPLGEKPSDICIKKDLQGSLYLNLGPEGFEPTTKGL